MKLARGVLVVLMGGAAALCAGQNTGAALPECAVELPSLTASSTVNLFNDRQEQDLGDAVAEQYEGYYRLAPPESSAALDRIGQRILASLPPTGIRYSFRIYESGSINGFSMPGGHVYISRKLIAAVKSEDELAGVLAHEIGHIYTHQAAIELSRKMRLRLGITQVGDRAEIFALVHKFKSTPRNAKESDESEEKDQLLADRVAVYAATRAGYVPSSFPGFYDQITENKGRTGNWLTDGFGLTDEDSKRYRTMRKLIEQLPASCQGRAAAMSTAFASWQRTTAEERVQQVATGLEGDRPLKLENPLRPSLWRVRFSPDGRYLLAQDEGSIAVVDRTAGKALFRIDAPRAEEAQFTPDSTGVVFHDRKLRVESWTIATGTRASVKELVVFGGCAQTALSADGKTLVCVQVTSDTDRFRVGVKLIEVESGKPYYENPKLMLSGVLGSWVVDGLIYRFYNRLALASALALSPDGRYMVLNAGYESLAYDLQARHLVAVGGKLKGLDTGEMAFMGANRLLVTGDLKGSYYKTRLLSFPEGQLIKEGLIGEQHFEATSDGKLLIVSPLKEYNVGLFEPETGNVLWASKLLSLDSWGGLAVGESAAGGLNLTNLSDGQAVQKIDLPLTPLPYVQSGTVSDDGNFMAVSMRYRAAIWNLKTGKRVALVRPFRSAWIDSGDQLYVQNTKYLQEEPSGSLYDLVKLSNKDLGKLEEKVWQYHDLQMRIKPNEKAGDGKHMTLEVKKMSSPDVLWVKELPRENLVVWSAEDERIVLGWDMNSERARNEVVIRPGLKPLAAALTNKKKGLLIETFSPETGADLEQTIIPEVDLTNGWNDERLAYLAGQFVAARGEHDNTVIYRFATAEKLAEFFGEAMEVDARSGLVAATNRSNEVFLVEEGSGKELKRMTFDSPVVMVEIVGGLQNTLYVFTADQVVHRLPLPQTETTVRAHAAEDAKANANLK